MFDSLSQEEEEQLLWVTDYFEHCPVLPRVGYLLLMSRKARDPKYKYTIKWKWLADKESISISKPNQTDTTRPIPKAWLMSELFFSKNTDDRSTILVYDVDWGCHWGVAINTCVIPLLPQSVNRAGGSQKLVRYASRIQQRHRPLQTCPQCLCLSMLATPTSSAMNSLLWVTSSSRSSSPPWLLNLANMFYKHVCAPI